MTSPSDPIITDRTSIETAWECEQKLYWYKLYGGTGVTPIEEPDYFRIGRDIHVDMEKLASAADPASMAEQIVVERLAEHAGTTDPLVLEPLYRHCGWLLAWGWWKEPLLRSQGWATEAIEYELVFERDGVQVSCIPDRILYNASRGKRVYREYKSVKDATPGWIAYWPFAIQCHLGIAAYQEDTGKEVDYAIITGLKKGFEKDGKLRHPYVWAYSDGAGHYQEGWGRGLVLQPIWEKEGGLIQWVRELGPEVGLSQFPESAPIFLQNRLLDAVIAQTKRREGRYEGIRQAEEAGPGSQAGEFEQRFTKCRPVFGSPCAYLACCHNATIGADPLGSGIYRVRVPHHDLERIARGLSYE
jgi:hypothetical protein